MRTCTCGRFYISGQNQNECGWFCCRYILAISIMHMKFDWINAGILLINQCIYHLSWNIYDDRLPPRAVEWREHTKKQQLKNKLQTHFSNERSFRLISRYFSHENTLDTPITLNHFFMLIFFYHSNFLHQMNFISSHLSFRVLWQYQIPFTLHHLIAHSRSNKNWHLEEKTREREKKHIHALWFYEIR